MEVILITGTQAAGKTYLGHLLAENRKLYTATAASLKKFLPAPNQAFLVDSSTKADIKDINLFLKKLNIIFPDWKPLLIITTQMHKAADFINVPMKVISIKNINSKK